MSFWDHLQELRTRIIKCAVFLVAGFCLTYAYRFRIWEWVQKPLTELLEVQSKHVAESPFAFTGLTEPFFSLLRVAFWAACFLIAPLIFYQIWAFIRPGLYDREKKLVIPFVIITSICFLSGAIFAYLFAFKSVANILLDQAIRANLRPNLRLNEYLDIFINIIVGTGLVFEMPILVYFLAKFRLVAAKMMLKYWRHATIAILVVASLITPGDILVTTVFITILMLALYFISTFVAWFAEPKANESDKL
jgi:sec-independent protein translocase protein TatC